MNPEVVPVEIWCVVARGVTTIGERMYETEKRAVGIVEVELPERGTCKIDLHCPRCGEVIPVKTISRHRAGLLNIALLTGFSSFAALILCILPRAINEQPWYLTAIIAIIPLSTITLWVWAFKVGLRKFFFSFTHFPVKPATYQYETDKLQHRIYQPKSFNLT